MRVVDRRLFELIVRQLGRLVRGLQLSILLQQIRSHALGIEELFELHGRQVANLLLGVVDAALLADAAADLFHDLLDVDGVGTDVEIGHI